MPREALLARTMVEQADTLVDDFDVVELLTLLNNRCVEMLDVSAAGRAFSWLRHHDLLLVDVAQSVIDGTLAPDPPLPSRS